MHLGYFYRLIVVIFVVFIVYLITNETLQASPRSTLIKDAIARVGLVKKMLPIKADEYTTCFDVEFKEKDMKIVSYYLFNIDDETRYYIENDSKYMMDTITEACCEYSKKDPLFVNGITFEHINFDPKNKGKEWFRIIVNNRICKKYHQ